MKREDEVKRVIDEASEDSADIKSLADRLISRKGGRLAEQDDEFGLDLGTEDEIEPTVEEEEPEYPTVIVEVHEGYATVAKKDAGVVVEIVTYTGEGEEPQSEVYAGDEQIPSQEEEPAEEEAETEEEEGEGSLI